MIGGRLAGYPWDTDVVEVYDPVAALWSTSDPISNPRTSHGLEAQGGHLFVVGGYH